MTKGTLDEVVQTNTPQTTMPKWYRITNNSIAATLSLGAIVSLGYCIEQNAETNWMQLMLPAAILGGAIGSQAVGYAYLYVMDGIAKKAFRQ